MRTVTRPVTVFLVLALSCMVGAPASGQATPDLEGTVKQAEKRIRELVKEQVGVRKQAVAITARLTRSKFPQQEGAEQQALYAYEDALNTEQITIERIIGIVQWDADVAGGTQSGGRARAAMKEYELTTLGQSLAMSLPRKIGDVTRAHEAAQSRWNAAQTGSLSPQEMKSLQRELQAYVNAPAAMEDAVVSAAHYLAAIGAKSLGQYKAQLDAIQERNRAKAAGRMRPEDAGAIVLWALSAAILASGPGTPEQLRAERGAAHGRCAILGGAFMPGTGSEIGTCSR